MTGGDATNNNNNQTATLNNQNSSPAKTRGGQFRELQAAQAWFNNYHTKPGKDRNSEDISRYLDQYASAGQPLLLSPMVPRIRMCKPSADSS